VYGPWLVRTYGIFNSFGAALGGVNQTSKGSPRFLPMVRILIADDHNGFRSCLRSILERQPGWDVCGEAIDGHEAVELARTLKPDIVVLDFFMPRINGLDAARQILKEVPAQKIMFLSIMYSEETARIALEIGARGYVVKTNAAHDLVAGIKTMMHNRPFFAAWKEREK
jgi:DNA-binding NarL/FixJ family response regulator